MIELTLNHPSPEFRWNLERTENGSSKRFAVIHAPRELIPLLLRNDYVVCEKSDGVRALLLSASGSVFLVGRLEEVHEIKMKLPVRGNFSESQQLTLLDGEVVMVRPQLSQDTNHDDGSTLYRYLCYDGICIQRKPLNKMNLLERLSFVYTDVIVPLRLSRAEGLQTGAPDEGANFEIYLKVPKFTPQDFFDVTHIKHVSDISVKLPHISDGLIFTPVNLPYSPGTCKSLLKWKPPHLNTVRRTHRQVDFSIDVLYDGAKRPRLVQLFVSDSVGPDNPQGTRVFYNEFLAPYGEVYKSIIDMALTDQLTQIIVECSWITDSRVYTFIPNIRAADAKTRNAHTGPDGKIDYDFDNGTWIEGGWYAERIREDKNMPNHISVVRSVKASIEDDITFDMLVEEVAVFKRNGKVPLYDKCLLPKAYEAA